MSVVLAWCKGVRRDWLSELIHNYWSATTNLCLSLLAELRQPLGATTLLHLSSEERVCCFHYRSSYIPA